MQANNICPQPDMILALHRGELEGPPLDSVCDHLFSCTKCESRLVAIENDDEVLGNLRRFLGSEPSAEGSSSFDWVGTNPETEPHGEQEGLVHSSRRNEPPSAASEQPALPRIFGAYELQEVIGRGGMGIVYKASHICLNKPVAVKVIRPEYTNHPRIIARFQKESLAVGQLDHKHVVTASDAGVVDGIPYLVMEYVDGCALATLAPMPVAKACEAIRQAAIGLQYIHEQGLVHRDLKPSNLILTKRGRVKILDLGLAGYHQHEQSSESATRDNHWLGTPDYMAPEQWADSRNVDIRADIYSLGCSLYQLIGGKAPFSGPDYNSTARKQIAHKQTQAPSLRQLRPEVSPDLDTVLMRMMAKAPSDRFATPAEVARALLPFCQEQNTEFYREELAEGTTFPWGEVKKATEPALTARPVPNPTRPPSRRWRGYVAVLVVVGVVGALVWGLGSVSVDAGGESLSRPSTSLAVPPIPTGVTHNVLGRPPTLLMFPNRRQENTSEYLPWSSRYKVNTHDTALVQFGKVDRMNYQLQIGIKQNRWEGGVGVYIGCHEELIGNQPRTCLQVLSLERQNAANPKERWFLRRSRMALKGTDGGLEIRAENTLGFSFVDPLRSDQECTLTIEVGPFGLEDIRWDGAHLPNLITPELDRHFTQAYYSGGFGVFVRESSASFGNAKIIIPDGETP